MWFPDQKKGGVLRPQWRYRARGAIWRIIPTDSGKFVGEERDVEKKETTFFCVSQRSGEVLWQNVTFPERWWIGIETVHRDVVLLHGFATPDLPEHKGLIAIDLLTGTHLWTNEECKFIIAGGESVFVSRGEAAGGEAVLEMEYRTGATLHFWGDNIQAVRDAKDRISRPLYDAAEFPVPLESLDDDDVDAADLVRRHCADKSIVGRVELLDHSRAVVVNYYERLNKEEETVLRLKNTLAVLGRESGDLLFRETLDEDVPGTAPDSFFVYRDTLYYIKDRHTLTAVRIDVAIKD